MAPGRIRAVFLDVGETLVDETRVWEGWADWLGVPRFTFLAALGGVIQRGEDHMRVFELFRPDFDLARARTARREAGLLWTVQERDLYPDVRPALDRLRADGYLVGISGNQPDGMTEALGALHLSGGRDRELGRLGSGEAGCGLLRPRRRSSRDAAQQDRLRRRPA